MATKKATTATAKPQIQTADVQPKVEIPAAEVEVEFIKMYRGTVGIFNPGNKAKLPVKIAENFKKYGLVK